MLLEIATSPIVMKGIKAMKQRRLDRLLCKIADARKNIKYESF